MVSFLSLKGCALEAQVYQKQRSLHLQLPTYLELASEGGTKIKKKPKTSCQQSQGAIFLLTLTTFYPLLITYHLNPVHIGEEIL